MDSSNGNAPPGPESRLVAAVRLACVRAVEGTEPVGLAVGVHPSGPGRVTVEARAGDILWYLHDHRRGDPSPEPRRPPIRIPRRALPRGEAAAWGGGGSEPLLLAVEPAADAALRARARGAAGGEGWLLGRAFAASGAAERWIVHVVAAVEGPEGGGVPPRAGAEVVGRWHVHGGAGMGGLGPLGDDLASHARLCPEPWQVLAIVEKGPGGEPRWTAHADVGASVVVLAADPPAAPPPGTRRSSAPEVAPSHRAERILVAELAALGRAGAGGRRAALQRLLDRPDTAAAAPLTRRLLDAVRLDLGADGAGADFALDFYETYALYRAGLAGPSALERAAASLSLPGDLAAGRDAAAVASLFLPLAALDRDGDPRIAARPGLDSGFLDAARRLGAYARGGLSLVPPGTP